MGKITNNIKYIIIIILILLMFVLVYLFFNKENNNPESNNEKLVLFGESSILIESGTNYIEPGYFALNENNIDDTAKVIVKGNNFDTSIPGKYVISYIYNNIVKTRVVEVLEKKIELIFELKDKEEIELDLNEEYKDPGVIAKYGDIDLTNEVIVTSDLDITKPGSYKIKYVLKYDGKENELERNIKVSDYSLKVELVSLNTKYTNSYIEVKVNVTGDTFDYLILPSGNNEKKNDLTYKITENGEYTFHAYNSKGKEFVESITIENIDKIKPTGTCTATLKTRSTEFTIVANDNLSGINSYIYKDNNKKITTTRLNTYTYNTKSKNVSVDIVDNAGNTESIKCTINDKSYLPVIKPNSNENVTLTKETDTMKVYVSKFSNYYLTRIWVYDAYNQLNKFNSPEYGKKLYRPGDLLQKASESYNLKDKFLLGFNASGFYKKDTYDAASVRHYSGFDLTSVGTLVITNGKVIRNLYDKGDVITWFITGINKENKMVVFEDTKISETNSTDKKKWSENVINSIRNTYTFAAPIILDGNKTNYTNSNTRMPGNNSTEKGLQLLCQINENNYVLFTASKATRNTGINKFLELGCTTAVNLDGGGSIALVYKDKGTNTIKTIIGNSRSLPEVGYFSE